MNKPHAQNLFIYSGKDIRHEREKAIKAMIRSNVFPLPTISECVECFSRLEMNSVKHIPANDIICQCGKTWLIKWAIGDYVPSWSTTGRTVYLPTEY